jgi:hypothetical protein
MVFRNRGSDGRDEGMDEGVFSISLATSGKNQANQS